MNQNTEDGTHCEFCAIVAGAQPARVVCETADCIAFFPLKPVIPGHTLVAPKAHVSDIWSLGDSLGSKVFEAVLLTSRAIRVALQPDGLNIINSAGIAASQTVFHLHFHLVPRWQSDEFGDIWPPSQTWPSDSLDKVAMLIRDQCAT
jgi:histidine triad (HIT) family protein